LKNQTSFYSFFLILCLRFLGLITSMDLGL
jgi:hypothetical protein